ncbi:hypothetical protein [Cognataquiflexum aquatile]|uniref:hypothetical protein n=1 Tax=Cognataquiflexum aquatile TaxID=2249427 RepID=UPI000DE87DDA|nr:hypothetical protein [Cognataquiflexum aquatile]
MEIERRDNEIVIRVDEGTDLTGIQRLLDFIKFREITSKSKATQQQIDDLAKQAKSSWWEENKRRYIK